MCQRERTRPHVRHCATTDGTRCRRVKQGRRIFRTTRAMNPSNQVYTDHATGPLCSPREPPSRSKLHRAMDTLRRTPLGESDVRALPMNRIRVAIGEVQSGMSRDILAQITHLEPDIEFVGEVAHDNLKDDLARHRADVLICDVRADELPAVCQTLFAEQNAPIVVGLAREGREAAVCVPNAGSAQLMSLIRAAVLGAGEESRVVELVRPQEPARDAADPTPYTSVWECLNDQLRALDLALLAEVHAFESTTWEEGVQRLQGLAISPKKSALCC